MPGAHLFAKERAGRIEHQILPHARQVVQRPYGLESLCSDDQDTPFYLHQL